MSPTRTLPSANAVSRKTGAGIRDYLIEIRAKHRPRHMQEQLGGFEYRGSKGVVGFNFPKRHVTASRSRHVWLRVSWILPVRLLAIAAHHGAASKTAENTGRINRAILHDALVQEPVPGSVGDGEFYLWVEERERSRTCEVRARALQGQDDGKSP